MFAKGCGLCPCSVLDWFYRYFCVYVLIEGKGSHRTYPAAAACLVQPFIKFSVCKQQATEGLDGWMDG